MIIHTSCPKCKQPIDIDVTKQMNDLVEQRVKDKAEQLADRKLLQMKPVLEKQIRTDERKKITKDSAKLQKDNDQLSQRNTKLTKNLQQQERTVDIKAARLAEQRIRHARNEQAESNQQKNLGRIRKKGVGSLFSLRGAMKCQPAPCHGARRTSKKPKMYRKSFLTPDA